MNYYCIDGVPVIPGIGEYSPDRQSIELVSGNTKNTWQPGRDYGEKKKDTAQGKLAEQLFQEYAGQFGGFAYIPYDDIRRDGYRFHAPFDGLLYKRTDRMRSGRELEPLLDKICAEVADSRGNGKISADTRDALRSRKIYTVEVKSTRVNRKKHPPELAVRSMRDHAELINRIREDDYFVYPHFSRQADSGERYDFGRYVEETVRSGALRASDERGRLRELYAIECRHASDIQVRVYLDYITGCGYLMGYMRAADIIAGRHIGRMPGGKSEQAVYYKASLQKGRLINTLFSNALLWDKGDGEQWTE